MKQTKPTSIDKETRWQRWQRGQALIEYWPAIPVGVMVMISASALVGPIGNAFQTTADGLNNVVCEAPSSDPTYVDLEGGHRIEVIASNYDDFNDRTTVKFRVSSGDQPAISHWVLGIDEATADRIVDYSEGYEWTDNDPKTGARGIKFDTGYGEGGGGSEEEGRGPRRTRLITNPYRPMLVTYVDEREITLTLTGRVDFVETIEVTTKAGSDQVSSGYVSIPVAGGSSEEAC